MAMADGGWVSLRGEEELHCIGQLAFCYLLVVLRPPSTLGAEIRYIHIFYKFFLYQFFLRNYFHLDICAILMECSFVRTGVT